VVFLFHAWHITGRQESIIIVFIVMTTSTTLPTVTNAFPDTPPTTTTTTTSSKPSALPFPSLPYAVNDYIFSFLSHHHYYAALETSQDWYLYLSLNHHWKDVVISKWQDLKILPCQLMGQLERKGVDEERWYHKIFMWKTYDDVVEGNGGLC